MKDSGKGDLNSFTDEYCNKSKIKLKDCPKNSQTAKLLENLSRTPSDFPERFHISKLTLN